MITERYVKRYERAKLMERYYQLVDTKAPENNQIIHGCLVNTGSLARMQNEHDGWTFKVTNGELIVYERSYPSGRYRSLKIAWAAGVS